MDLINNYIQNGGNISYILSIYTVNPPTDEIENKIKMELFNNMHNIVNKIVVYGMDVTIIWKNISDNLYHCDVQGIWSDTAVNKHTQLLINEIINNTLNKYISIMQEFNTQVKFIILKPLTNKTSII